MYIPSGVAGEGGHVVAVVGHEAVGETQPPHTAVSQPVDSVQRGSVTEVEVGWKERHWVRLQVM